ncbi:MAG: TetR/AcrR family transcriptional regulator [Solobacterium sp.]|nr:TetR/AcrR family transcriptional regulator [Erysipelotrichaceae bacterium]MBQ9153955.1 TetR/AcrR family transcriptional regulator [Solobacterium sp.]
MGYLYMRMKSRGHFVVKDSLTEALLQLMSEKPFAEITVTELTDKAGISRATYYRNYSSKEEIISGFMTRMIDDFHKTYNITKIADRFVREYADYMLEYTRKYNALLHLVYDSGLSSIYLGCLNRYVLKKHSEEIQSEKDYYLLLGYCGAEFNLIFSGVIAREGDRQVDPEEISVMFESA